MNHVNNSFWISLQKILKVSILFVTSISVIFGSYSGVTLAQSEPAGTEGYISNIENAPQEGSSCGGAYCDKGYLDWRGSLSYKYSGQVKSTSKGWVCVATNLDSYNLNPGTSYRWRIQEKDESGWWNVRSSDRFLANGNIDKQCFDREIEPGRYYRAQFSLYSPGFVHGHYTIRGFHSDNGPIN